MKALCIESQNRTALSFSVRNDYACQKWFMKTYICYNWNSGFYSRDIICEFLLKRGFAKLHFPWFCNYLYKKTTEKNIENILKLYTPFIWTVWNWHSSIWILTGQNIAWNTV